MGAPKQKWTAEEENALTVGVAKHGPGKWRTILKDPEFSGVLALRSNVDLKDKWRNMAVVANGWGSREKARLAMKRSQQIRRHDDNAMVLSTVGHNFDDEIVDAKPLAITSGTMHITAPKRSISRLDNLILEAITSLKEPSGSNKTAIAMYIEDQYWAPPNFERLLSAKLKALSENGKLIKVKCRYQIAPSSSAFFEGRISGLFLLEAGTQREPPRLIEREEVSLLTKTQIDAELMKMRSMSTQDAAAAAAQAVAEAEGAMLEAEQAAREAEAAEADADAAQAFAEAALMTLNSRRFSKLMVPG
ncbi:telomere repeat-binding factor 1-like [Aristolochia californica]|uniref:telomere repeat-binding factor 1-like n=1 Tax=Aristolochia californica TaxID=171875 RepID=UPI0035DCFDBA